MTSRRRPTPFMLRDLQKDGESERGIKKLNSLADTSKTLSGARRISSALFLLKDRLLRNVQPFSELLFSGHSSSEFLCRPDRRLERCS